MITFHGKHCSTLSLLVIASVLTLFIYVAFIQHNINGYPISLVSIHERQHLCTFRRLKDYYRLHLHPPKQGQWSDGSPVCFRPEFCYVSCTRIPKDKLSECLFQKNISYITTLGDSNAAGYFIAINRVLGRAADKHCQVTNMERFLKDGFLPDLDYFVKGINANKSWAHNVKVHNRQCHGCASVKSACKLTYNKRLHNITIEQGAMTATLDDSIHVNTGSEAPTSQEFWLKYYLGEGYPDLLLVFLPFSHDKHTSSLIQLKASITYFHYLVKTYVPATTQVVYFPAFSEFENARTNILYINRTYGGLLAAEKINKMNKVLLEVIFDDVTNPESNINGFLDLFAMSLTHQEWSVDGIHMKDIWYDVIIDILWQIICNT